MGTELDRPTEVTPGISASLPGHLLMGHRNGFLVGHLLTSDVEAEGEDLLRPGEPGVHPTQGKEAADHEPRSHQENQGQGHLTHHQ